jgi:DNA-binding NtrC family response regulator
MYRTDAICLGELEPAGPDSLEALRRIRSEGCRAPVVLWLRNRTEAMLLEALRAGAADYLKDTDSLAAVAAAVCESAANRIPATCPPAPARESLSRIIGVSPAMDHLRSQLPGLAASDCSVLISGETGTGKDLAAELIHNRSRRSRSPLVCINCAAVPDSLLESELFGYDRGAFTGASASHPGKLECANHGTIFLDEIGEMSLHAQCKLLRVLEAREVQRLGSNASIPLDVRIVAASNQNLAGLIAAKTFRSDLFFRLSVARLHLPPLRERKQDIPELLHYYLGVLNRRTGNAVAGWTDAALRSLTDYDWPGNIRELRNLLKAIFIYPPSGLIGTGDLPEWFLSAAMRQATAPGDDRERLIGALSSTRWNKTRAAAELKWSRMTLYRKMKKYGIASEANFDSVCTASG